MIRICIVLCFISLFFSCINKRDSELSEVKVVFSDDMITKKWYHDNGDLKKIQDYTLDSIRHGRFLLYHENGQLSDSGYYDNGIVSGDYFLYYKNGKRESKRKYINGQLRNAINYDTLGEVTSYASCDYFGRPFFIARYDSTENIVSYESTHSSMLLHSFDIEDTVSINQYFDLELLVSDPINAETEVIIRDWDYNKQDWVNREKVKPDAYNRVKVRRKHSSNSHAYLFALAKMDNGHGLVLEDTLYMFIDRNGATVRVDDDPQVGSVLIPLGSVSN